MSESPSDRQANGHSVTDDLSEVSQEELGAGQSDLRRYRIEVESLDEGTRHVMQLHARSMEDALVKVRDADWWSGSRSGSDPAEFRVVEASEESGFSEARDQRNARRRYLNTIVEAGLTAQGMSAPERSDHEYNDILCDFFARAVVWPGQFDFPAEDGEADRLLRDDVSTVLTRLLTTQLAHRGLTVTQVRPQ